jgi:RNA polymerase sigma-70 factor (ECF subfamily)
LTLLDRIKDSDPEAWRRFVELYSPLVHRWCGRFGLQEADVEDVRQNVFGKVAKVIGGFRRDRPGDTFRGWLWSITHSRALDLIRQRQHGVNGDGGTDAQDHLVKIPDDRAKYEASEYAEDDKLLLVRRVVELVLKNCQEKNRQAFLRVVIDGHHPADVARELGMTPNAVYLAKSHILKRIRDEFAHVVDI